MVENSVCDQRSKSITLCNHLWVHKYINSCYCVAGCVSEFSQRYCNNEAFKFYLYAILNGKYNWKLLGFCCLLRVKHSGNFITVRVTGVV